MKAYEIKLMSIKLTILSSLLAFAAVAYYFTGLYSFNKAFQLATLTALAVAVGAGALFFLLSFLLIPLLSRSESREERISPETEEAYTLPKKERIIRHETKEDYIQNNSAEREAALEEQEKLNEIKESRGTFAEVMLLLPYDLSFMLSKESITHLAFGKIKEENMESGRILGTAGFGPSPQEIEITLHGITEHSTTVDIISRSSRKQQSDKKNLAYIKKISDFLRKKERRYTDLEV